MASTCFFAGPWIEQAVDGWSNWMYRTVALLSLASHLILAVFANIRRRESRCLRRGLVWVAYQLTDWAPAYVMGNLYIETSPRKKMIFAFWVPFLLLHNARPDNISAYSMEDSGLSARLAIVVPFQTLGSIYLMCRYILADCTTGVLRWASCIMLFLGIFKYVESAVALWRADLGNIWSSFKLQPQPQQHPSSFIDDYGGGGKLQQNDEKALLLAHDLFDICKGTFADYPVDLGPHKTSISLFTGNWETMCKVVEMELSLMYDILYTKAAVVHTWGGYAIRVASPPLTAAALLLFCLHRKEGMEPADKIISYILLWMTLLLDVTCLVRALASSWTHSFFKVRPHSWLKHEFWCRGRWNKLRLIVMSLRLSRLSMWLWTCEGAEEPKSNRVWESSFWWCNLPNLLYQFIRGWDTLCGRSGLAKKIESENYSSGLENQEYGVNRLVFKNTCTRFPARAVEADHWRLGQASSMYNQALPEVYQQQPDYPRHGSTSIMHMKLDKDMILFPPGFQEAILIWHITTDVFLGCSPTVPSALQKHVKGIRLVSDYMLYLATTKVDMLTDRKFHILYETMIRTLKMAARGSSSGSMKQNELVMWLLMNKDGLKGLGTTAQGTERKNKDYQEGTATRCLWEGTQIADALLSQMEGGSPRSTTTEETGLAYWIPNLWDPHGDMKGMLEFILAAWVDMLVHASLRCSKESHAKQLGRGGELVTIIWIITKHASIDVMKSKYRASMI